MSQTLKAEIESQNQLFMRAVRSGDAATVASLYTADAWLLPPGTDIIKGHSDIESFWRTRFARIAEVKLATIDVLALGPDSAREVGRSEIALKDSGSGPIAGKYVVVWNRIDGEWKLETDMFNNNA